MRFRVCSPVCALALLALTVQSSLAGEAAAVRIVAGQGFIDFFSGDQLVARYNTGPDLAKPYLWPLNGPGGVCLTRSWPMDPSEPKASHDHPHQKSAWFCHGDVIPDGLKLNSRIRGIEGVDFWSEARGHGRIVCTLVGQILTAQNPGAVTTRNEWRTAGGRKVLDETRVIRLHDYGDTRLFVFDCDLAASSVPVTFGDTKEGSFGIRVNDRITELRGHGKLENADGKIGEKNCWGRLSAWCDYSGPLGGRMVGIAILDDPRNRYPACWHSRGYGLMAANPFGRANSGFPAMKGRSDLVHLAKGQHLKLRYGLLLHPGDAHTGQVAEYFQKFVKLKGRCRRR